MLARKGKSKVGSGLRSLIYSQGISKYFTAESCHHVDGAGLRQWSSYCDNKKQMKKEKSWGRSSKTKRLDVVNIRSICEELRDQKSPPLLLAQLSYELLLLTNQCLQFQRPQTSLNTRFTHTPALTHPPSHYTRPKTIRSVEHSSFRSLLATGPITRHSHNTASSENPESGGETRGFIPTGNTATPNQGSIAGFTAEQPSSMHAQIAAQIAVSNKATMD